MSCPSSAKIAAAAGGEDAAAAEHAETCAVCAAAVAKARATRALIAELPEVRLGASHRAALRAELLAASDALPVQPRRRRWIAAGVAAVAAAAAVVLMIGRGGGGEQASGGSQIAAPGPAPIAAEPPAAPVPGPGSAVVRDRSAELVAKGARFERAGDAVKLAEGVVVLDARGRRAAEIVAVGARVQVDDAKVRVTVHAGRLVQVQVFAGSAQVHLAGRTQVVEVGEVWIAPAPAPAARPASPPVLAPAPASEPPPVISPSRPASAAPSPALEAFRQGWQALRAGRNTDAVSAFDRATDPAVAEDASYWAAIAAARAGDRGGAQRRLQAFLAAFPDSPHAGEARAALDR